MLEANLYWLIQENGILLLSVTDAWGNCVLSIGKFSKKYFVRLLFYCHSILLPSRILTCCRMGFHAHDLAGCSKQPSRGQTSCRALQGEKSESFDQDEDIGEMDTVISMMTVVLIKTP